MLGGIIAIVSGTLLSFGIALRISNAIAGKRKMRTSQ